MFLQSNQRSKRRGATWALGLGEISVYHYQGHHAVIKVIMAVGRTFHLSAILLSISLLLRLSFEPSIFKLQDNAHESFGYELLHSSTSRLADFKSFLSISTLLNLSDNHRVIWFKRKFFKCLILC